MTGAGLRSSGCWGFLSPQRARRFVARQNVPDASAWFMFSQIFGKSLFASPIFFVSQWRRLSSRARSAESARMASPAQDRRHGLGGSSHWPSFKLLDSSHLFLLPDVSLQTGNGFTTVSHLLIRREERPYARPFLLFFSPSPSF